MPAPKKSPRPRKRPEEVTMTNQEVAEARAVKSGNNEAARRASQDNELLPNHGEAQKFGDGGMTTPKPRGCGAAQMSGFRGGETY